MPRDYFLAQQGWELEAGVTNDQVLYRAAMIGKESGNIFHAYGPYEREQDAKSIITRRRRYWAPTAEFQIQKARVVWEPVE